MSAKTKIVVLKLKEIIYTCIFVGLGILFLLILISLFLPSKDSRDTAANAAVPKYTPGTYTTELLLGSDSVQVHVTVDTASITALELGDVTDNVAILYPLLSPTFDSLREEICSSQKLPKADTITENKYTNLVLLEAIRNSLEKASVK